MNQQPFGEMLLKAALNGLSFTQALLWYDGLIELYDLILPAGQNALLSLMRAFTITVITTGVAFGMTRVYHWVSSDPVPEPAHGANRVQLGAAGGRL